MQNSSQRQPSIPRDGHQSNPCSFAKVLIHLSHIGVGVKIILTKECTLNSM